MITPKSSIVIKKIILFLLVGFGMLLLCLRFWPKPNEQHTIEHLEEPIENLLYGLPADSFLVYQAEVAPNEFFSHILNRYGIPYSTIEELVKKSSGIFDVRKMAAGNPYTVFCSSDSSGNAQCFIYETNASEYVVFDMRDTIQVYKGSKPVEIKTTTTSGVITTSLYHAMKNETSGVQLALDMSDIYAWSIDFYRLQKNDSFLILYDEKYIDGKLRGIGRIHACIFYHVGKAYHAYYFNENEINGYFNETGQSLKKAFLKAPLKFSRITSGYTMQRFHPVQKTNKPHLGTDYAAPQGTPIMATGDGVVSEATFKQYNGNYVRIKHNATYSTQYLHMQKIAPGIRPGVHVKQGDIIGYVGSTGLATGPHVCYRFWKNNKQVNHLREEFPHTEPIPAKYLDAFKQHKDSLIQVLQQHSHAHAPS